jgi:hypothetical protein
MLGRCTSLRLNFPQNRQVSGKIAHSRLRDMDAEATIPAISGLRELVRGPRCAWMLGSYARVAWPTSIRYPSGSRR